MTSPVSSNPCSDCKLISVTPNAEDLIVYCARVSNPSNQNNKKTAPKLLRHLIEHGHWSPLEMAHMVIEVNTTRGISAQIIRHRSFSVQEFSQRYMDVSALGMPIVPHLRRQDTKNRQNSIDDIDLELKQKYETLIENHYKNSMGLYQKMLDNGIAKECARGILPMNSRSRLYLSGTIRSFVHYIAVRRRTDTQLEHRVIANEFENILEKWLPNVWSACNDMDWKFNLK